MKWTDEEIKRFVDYFGNQLPNPTNYPKTFSYYVKLWRYINRENKK